MTSLPPDDLPPDDRPPAAAQTPPIGTSDRVRDQPALTTSTGRSWMILGSLLAAICLALFVPMLQLRPVTAAATGICAVVVLYAALVIVRVNVRDRRRMLAGLATCLILMAASALGCVLWVAASQVLPGE